jgi:two-component system CheB/CheR fusion protein
MGIRGSNRDITDLKKVQKRLQHVAGHDELTGLANRSLLLEYLEQSLKEAKRNQDMFAVAFIDLDGFKNINDTYGHDAGDHVLKKVAHNLQNNLRADDIIARFGGDEFVGVFAINKALDVTTLQKKIFDQINTHIDCKTFKITIELSVGISIYPIDGTTVDALLSKADNEMYIMKAKNKEKRKQEKKKAL